MSSGNSRYKVDLTGRNPREKKQAVQDIPGAEGRRTAATGREDTGYYPLGKPTPNVKPFGAISLEGRNPIEKKQKPQDIPGAEERRTSPHAARHGPVGGKRRKGRKSRKVRKSKAKRKKGRKSRKARKTGKNKRRKRGGRRTRRTRRRRNH